MDKSTRIGFVGVGRMGANMAAHLHDLGYNITVVHDTWEKAAREVAEHVGARKADSLADVTVNADLIFTVVSDDAAQRRIFTGEGDNLLRGDCKGKLFVNCATVSPEVHVEVEKATEACGGGSIEACMASSIPQARKGTLYFMVAGKREHFEKAEPILKDMSQDLVYMGSAGKAAQVKALVNMVMNINTAALAEGLGLADSLGLDLDLVMRVFSQTGANSRVLETDGPDMKAREHDCFFSAAHAAKDSGIAAQLGQSHGLQLPLNEATLHQYRRMEELGLGELDKSGIAELTFKGRGGKGLKK